MTSLSTQPHSTIYRQLHDRLTQDQTIPTPPEILERLETIIATIEVDMHELLSKRQQIAVIWSLADVQEVRPDLTPHQCWIVLQACRSNHDAEVGINWEVLRCQAEFLFGDAP